MVDLNWFPLAHKEFDESIRSKGVWVFGALLLIGYWLSLTPSAKVRHIVSSDVAIAAFQNPIGLLVPIAAVLLTYRSVTGERESGSIKFVSGMPQTRAEILLGKVVGRSAALGTCLFCVFVIGAITEVVKYGMFSPATFALFAIASELYVVVNVAVGTGFSALAGRSRRSGGAVLAYYLLVILLWSDFVSNRVYTLVTGVAVDPLSPPASVALFLWRRVSPVASFNVLTNAILGVGNSDGLYDAVVFQLDVLGFTNVFVVSDVFDTSVPFYLSKSFSLVILVVWIIGPLLFGYIHFRRSDLGGGGTESSSRGWDRLVSAVGWPMTVITGTVPVPRLPQRWWRTETPHFGESPRRGAPSNAQLRRFARWVPLARREFVTTIRYKVLWAFLVALLLGAYLTASPPRYVVTAFGPNIAIAAFQVPLWFFTPFAAVLVSYRSVTAERETGSIKFVAGMPQTRGEILLGKIIGQVCAIGIFVLIAMCTFAVLKAPFSGIISPNLFLLFALVSVMYVLTNVSFAMGVSAMVDRSVQAASIAFGYLIVFNPYVWIVVSAVAHGTPTQGGTNPATGPPADPRLFLLRRISPDLSYTVLTNAVLGVGNSDEAYYTVLRELRPGESVGYVVGEVFTRPIPFYLSEWVPIAILLVWTIVPAIIGYTVFKRKDLG